MGGWREGRGNSAGLAHESYGSYPMGVDEAGIIIRKRVYRSITRALI